MPVRQPHVSCVDLDRFKHAGFTPLGISNADKSTFDMFHRISCLYAIVLALPSPPPSTRTSHGFENAPNVHLAYTHANTQTHTHACKMIWSFVAQAVPGPSTHAMHLAWIKKHHSPLSTTQPRVETACKKFLLFVATNLEDLLLIVASGTPCRFPWCMPAELLMAFSIGRPTPSWDGGGAYRHRDRIT